MRGTLRCKTVSEGEGCGGGLVNSPAQARDVSSPPQSERGVVAEGEVCIVALYFLVALGSIALTRNAGGSSLLWPANAIAAAFLVRSPSVRWVRISIGL